MNNSNPEEIGEYISALSNSATLLDRPFAYLVWGIENTTHDVVGTSFRPSSAKKGNEDLESWLTHNLEPKVDFSFFEFPIDGHPISLLKISRAQYQPIAFKGKEYIRIGSYKKPLKANPEKERELWRRFDRISFEDHIALDNLTVDDVFGLIEYVKFFEMQNMPLPDGKSAIIERLKSDRIVIQQDDGAYSITNLGALTFAKQLQSFPKLSEKAIRVVEYEGSSRIETKREQLGGKGYAVGFSGLIEYIKNLLPENEVIRKSRRETVRMYPVIAIRELVANALIHQDFHVHGSGPMVEIFKDRMEISNPGIPLVDTLRFLDERPISRNKILTRFMYRLNICEERGSGIDKVVFQTELYQLPAPEFKKTDNHTVATLFAQKEYAKMDKKDRIRACYLHACLRYVNRDPMTNASLRERFGIDEPNYSMVSRVIRDTKDDGLVKDYDPDTASKKHAKYIPCWA